MLVHMAVPRPRPARASTATPLPRHFSPSTTTTSGSPTAISMPETARPPPRTRAEGVQVGASETLGVRGDAGVRREQGVRAHLDDGTDRELSDALAIAVQAEAAARPGTVP